MDAPHSLRPAGPASGLTARSASAVLAAASLVMLALLAYVGRWLTFWSDEWSWIFGRPDPSVASLLGGSDVHLHLFPVLIYQAFFRLVGLGWYYPYLAVSWALHLACVWLLFAIAGRLAGWGFGLVAGCSLLFLGSGFEVLLQPGQMGYTLSEATGLLALLLLLRAPGSGRARLHRVGACIALTVGVASSGVGMFFVGLVLVWAALRRDRPSFAAAAPAFVLFGVWFSIWSQRTTTRVEPTVEGLLQIPLYVAHGVGAAVTAVVGLPPYKFAVAGVAIAVAGAGIAWWLGGRLDALALGALGALLAEFALVGGFRPEFGIVWTARSGYLHPAVAFLWLIAAGVWAGERFRLRSWLRPWMAAAVLVLAILGNMVQFAGAARGMRVQRATEIAYLRLLEALRDSPDVDPDMRFMFGITPRKYLATIERFGAPRLASREPSFADPGAADRSALDQALLRVLAPGIRAAPRGGIAGGAPSVAVGGGVAEPAGERCVRVVAGEAAATATWKPDGGAFTLRAGTPAALRSVRLGVFAAPRQIVEPGRASAHDADVTVRLPRLPAGARWSAQAEVAPRESVTICGAAG